MFQKLKTILKRRAHPFGLLAGSLSTLLLLTALTGMWHYQYELDHPSQPAPAAAINYSKTGAKAASLAPAGVQNTSAVAGQATTVSKPGAATTNQVVSVSTTSKSGDSLVASGITSSPVANITVSLSVNGSYKGQATLPGSSNQCDVLSAALQEGIISDLDMRYNAQYKTYAVYVIDGIGESDAVWWTYAVNGKSPPLGCSNTAVHGGDSVNWQYIKG